MRWYVFLTLWLILFSVIFNATAFIIFPVKFDEELEKMDIEDWSFGWAYGLGWAVSILFLGSAFLLWLDKDTDEIIFREKTSYNNEGIEEVGRIWGVLTFYHSFCKSFCANSSEDNFMFFCFFFVFFFLIFQRKKNQVIYWSLAFFFFFLQIS